MTDIPAPPDKQDHAADLFARLGTYVDMTDPEMVAARARFLEAVQRRLRDAEAGHEG